MATGTVAGVLALELLELLDDVLLLPQAARPTPSASIAEALAIKALVLLHVVSLIRRLLLVVFR
ncbi:MAG TPA: hypothetical protein VGH78_04275 [Solirubrobacteraceae bacterium]